MIVAYSGGLPVLLRLSNKYVINRSGLPSAAPKFMVCNKT